MEMIRNTASEGGDGTEQAANCTSRRRLPSQAPAQRHGNQRRKRRLRPLRKGQETKSPSRYEKLKAACINVASLDSQQSAGADSDTTGNETVANADKPCKPSEEVVTWAGFHKCKPSGVN